MGRVSKALTADKPEYKGDTDRNWMGSAVKKPGALRATAAAQGGMGPGGKIKRAWLAKAAKGKGKTAKRARLAETFSKFRPGK